MDKLESRPDITPYRYAFHFFLLALIIAIIYSNTLFQEWHFDDYPNIIEDTILHWKNITFNSIWNTVTTDGFGQNSISRPIPRLTFALNYYFTGLNTLSYHLTNIVIHLITSFFVYLVFQKTLIILKTRGGVNFADYTCQDIALLGAVLWAIHPLQTQAVTYIVQRMASMAAMFYIMAMFFYIQGRLKDGEFKAVLFFCATFVFWLFAVLSKENAVLLPLSIIIYELIFFGLTKRKILYILCLLFLFAVSAVCVLLFTQGNNSGSLYEMYSALLDRINEPYTHRPFNMMERLLTEPRILVWYLFLIFCPISDFLSLESDITVSTGIFQPISTFTSIIYLLMILSVSVFYYKKIKIISYAVLFFFVNHIVESTFFGLELYFEHRNYLPSIFLYLAISYGLMRLYSYYQDKNRVVMNYLITFFIVCILVSEGNATYLRNDVWQTEETLHQDNLVKVPNNIRPKVSLSSYYIRQGKFEEAVKLLHDGEDIVNSGTVRVQKNWIGLLYHNLGSAYYLMSELEKSKSNLLKSLEYDQYSWETHAVLGIIFFLDGEIDQSIKAYTNAINLHRTNPKLFNMFGRALYASGDFSTALKAFDKGLELAKSNQQLDLVKSINFNITACHIALEDFINARTTLRTIEKDFDSIFYRYNLYNEDDIHPLQEIALYNDLIYLLYKSILFPESNMQYMEKIVVHIMSSSKEYCEIINEIKRNKYIGVIYPSIHDMEKDLLELYHEKMKNSIEIIQNKMSTSLNCSFSED